VEVDEEEEAEQDEDEDEDEEEEEEGASKERPIKSWATSVFFAVGKLASSSNRDG